MIIIRLASAADVPALAELRRVSTFEQFPEPDDEDFEDRFASWHERESSRRAQRAYPGPPVVDGT